MPYRDEIEALKARVDALTAELEDTSGRLERARAALASVVADMAGLPAAADIPWRSLHGGEPIVARFVNGTPQKLELVWIGYEGKARTEVSLVPGGEREQRTYVGHLFRAIDPASGDVVFQRYVRADEPRIVIEARLSAG